MSYNFYPGPSAVYPQVAQFMQQAYTEGVLGWNHRSPEFVALSRGLQELFRSKLDIPADYFVFYTSSATEGWAIVNQAFRRLEGHHFFNGAFGQKWYKYRQKVTLETTFAYPFALNELPTLPNKLAPKTILHFTQNETSNATQVPLKVLQEFRQQFPEALLAIDATSSLGGITLDWKVADLWLASVQKCLGMPAGMGLLIASPRAIVQAETTGSYNDLKFLTQKMSGYQTTYTPNVLAVYLLKNILAMRPPIRAVEEETQRRAKAWYTFFEQHKTLRLLVENPEVRSDTVIAVQGKEKDIEALHQAAQRAGFVLGKGYGDWAKTTFRIANFPAIPVEGIERLRAFLK